MRVIVFVSAVCALALASPRHDDCAYYAAQYSAALAQRDMWSVTLAYDQLAVSELLANRDTPLPLIEAAIDRCLMDEALMNDCQGDANAFYAAMGQACP